MRPGTTGASLNGAPGLERRWERHRRRQARKEEWLARKAVWRERLRESCEKSRGCSCGQARKLLQTVLMAPLVIPWTWIKLIFYPYIRAERAADLLRRDRAFVYGGLQIETVRK